MGADHPQDMATQTKEGRMTHPTENGRTGTPPRVPIPRIHPESAFKRHFEGCLVSASCNIAAQTEIRIPNRLVQARKNAPREGSAINRKRI